MLTLSILNIFNIVCVGGQELIDATQHEGPPYYLNGILLAGLYCYLWNPYKLLISSELLYIK